jgi:hypothetical protein
MATNLLSVDEQVALLRRLTSLTANGTVKWHVVERSDTFERDDVFQTRVDAFVFVLSSADSDGVAPYELMVLHRPAGTDQKTQRLAEIEMKPIDEAGPSLVNSLLDNLYTDVARRTLRSDETVRELFDSLERLAPSEDDPPF